MGEALWTPSDEFEAWKGGQMSSTTLERYVRLAEVTMIRAILLVYFVRDLFGHHYG